MDIALRFREEAVKFPDRPAVIFENEIVSFGQMNSLVNRLAGALSRRGVKKEDKIAVFLPNCPEYVISYLAVFSLGAAIVPLDSNLTLDEVKGVLRHSEAAVFISRPLKEYSFSRLKEEINTLKDIIVVSEEENIEGFSSFEGVLEDSLDEIMDSDVDDSSLAVLFYTSGTTGKPKAVMLSYKNLENACKTMAHIGVERYFGSMQICALPLSHIGGMIYLQIMTEYAAGIVLVPRFIPLEFLRNIEKYRVNWFHIVPAMFMALLQLKEFEKYDLSSVTGVNIFGAPSHPSLIERFGKYCCGATLWHGWGMTETSAPNMAVDSRNLRSVGKNPPWLEVKIFDNSDNELPAGEVGEIVCKGWPVMMGYYKEPELTEEIMKGGWLHTGDLGSLDEEGYLYIKGRKKDMIIVGGLNVYSPEVEHIILEHPKIKEAAVVGSPDKLRGEVVKAVVVLKEGEHLTANDLRDFCRRKLINFKVPQIIEVTDALPKTRTGKIQKELLKTDRRLQTKD